MAIDVSNREHAFDYFREQFSKESERASVILAAAMLEQALEAYLKSSIVPLSTQTDDLFDGPYAPLSTFEAKIDLSYRIALIEGNIARALHLVRKIRNQFAHDITGCSFEDARVRSRVLEFSNAVGVVKAGQKYREDFGKGLPGDFEFTVAYLLFILWYRAEYSEPMKSRPDKVPDMKERGE